MSLHHLCVETLCASRQDQPPFTHIYFDAPNPMQLNWVISQLVVCCEKFFVLTFDAMASASMHMMSLVKEEVSTT